MCLFLCSIPGAVTLPADEISEANWTTHGAIVEVRDIYGEVEDGIRNGLLRAQSREFPRAAPDEDRVRVLYLDRDGTPRKYVMSGLVGNALTVISFYYDRLRTLRFIFITEPKTAGQGRRAVGAAFEHRIYFDADGNRIWESIRHAEAKARTVAGRDRPPAVWPKESLVFDPVAAFRR